MSSGANHVSLLFTGSIRNALQMMLERLQRRGLVDQRDRNWYIVDPLFSE